MHKSRIIAIAGILAAGLSFRAGIQSGQGQAVVAALADTATNTATNTATSTATNTATNTATSTAINTAINTATNTATATTIATPVATQTAVASTTTTPTATATVVPGLTSPTTAYFAEGYTGSAATNGRASFTETLNIMNPSSVAVPVQITYFVQGAGAPTMVTRTVAADTVLRENVNTDVGQDKLVAAEVTANQHVFVTRTMNRVAPNGTRLDGSASLPVNAPARLWLFPEGYTGVTFQEYLTILNPTTTQADVTVTLAPQASSSQGARTLTLSVPPMSRSTANIRALNQTGAQSVGMIINSTQPIVAERVLYFGDGAGSGKFGSTVARGTTTVAQQLYIPYGSSGGLTASGSTMVAQGDQAFITLLNPGQAGTSVQVNAVFMGGAGNTLGQPQTVTVAGGTRQTIVVDPVLGSNAVGPYSVRLTATGPIAAESAQYYAGSPNVGRHPGVDFPALTGGNTDVFLSGLDTALPDGTSLNRLAYLYNPGPTQVQVNASYFGSNGNVGHDTYLVPAGGITTVDVSQDAGVSLPPGQVGAQFSVVGGNGSIMVASVGRTSDGLDALEDTGVTAF